MTPPSWSCGAPQRRDHFRKYAKDDPPDVIFLTFGRS
jgi:hypothetical protein